MPSRSAGRRRWFIAVAALISLALALTAAELLLRMSGYVPVSQCADLDEPVLYEPDALLGWKPKVGHLRHRRPQS